MLLVDVCVRITIREVAEEKPVTPPAEPADRKRLLDEQLSLKMLDEGCPNCGDD